MSSELIGATNIDYKCTACSIMEYAINEKIHIKHNCMDGSGPLEAEVLIVGEAPGEEEDERGAPFLGRAGKKLDECLQQAGLDRSCIRVTNACRCRPTAKVQSEYRKEVSIVNATPSGADIMTCAEKWLDAEIRSMPNLKVIVPLGNVPLFAVLGRFSVKKPPAKATSKITSMRGTIIPSEQYEGVVIIPSYHPAYILRSPEFEPYLVKDLQLVKQYLSGKEQEKKPVNYREVRSIEGFEKLVELIKSTGKVAWDTETTSKDQIHGEKILSFTFSVAPFSAFYVPFWEGGSIMAKEDLRNYWFENFGQEGYDRVVSGLREIFENPDIKKIGHNVKFDAAFIDASMGVDGKALGIKMENWHFDTMVAHFMLSEKEAHDLKTLSGLYTDLGQYDSDLDEDYKGIKHQVRLENSVREAAKKALDIYDATGVVDFSSSSKRAYEHFQIDVAPSCSDEDKSAAMEELRKKDLRTLVPHYGMIPLDIIKLYSLQDADATMRLYVIFKKEVESRGEDFAKVFYHLRMPVCKRLKQAEVAGMCVDIPLMESMIASFDQRQREIEDYVCLSLGLEEVNIASVVQLRNILYNDKDAGGLGLEVIEKTETGAPSTNKKTLDKLYEKTKNDVLKAIIEWRHLANLRNTFLEGMLESVNPVTGRVHPNFQVARAQTQRIVCSKPNLLNIPRDDPGNPDSGQEGSKIRNIFIPKPPEEGEPVSEHHVFVDGDLSQAEIRVFAGLSQDEVLLKMLREGIDIHSYFANIIYHHNLPISELWRFKEDPELKAQRSRTKNMVFGTLYGQNEYGAEKTLNIPKEEAKRIIDTFFSLCPKGKEWIEDTKRFARQHGYVKTPLGVYRHLKVLLDPHQEPSVIAEAERIAVNSPIQTHASDYNCLAFLETCYMLDKNGIWYEPKVIVYDSIIIECKLKDASFVKSTMETAMTRKRVGYDVDMACDMEIVTRWSGKKVDVDASLSEGRIITKE